MKPVSAAPPDPTEPRPGVRTRWRARLREAVVPLARRAFRLHWCGYLLSWAGSAVAPLALAFAALATGGGPRALGVVLAAGVLPQIVLLPVGGVIADRYHRVRVMVWSNVVCALAETAAACLIWSGTVQVWQLAVTAGVCGAAGAFFVPAADGAVVQVVPAGQRHTANALLKFGQNVGKMASPALGGVLIAAAGPAFALVWDAVTFAVSAVLFARIKVSRTGPRPESAAPRRGGPGAGLRGEMGRGWREVWDRRWLAVMVCQAAVTGSAWLAGYQLLGPLYGQRVLGGAALWGVVVSAFTGGLIAGAALALAWRPSWVGAVVCAGTGALALPLAAIAVRAPLPALVAAFVVAGAGLELAMVVWLSLLQERIPGDRLGRVLSYSTLGQMLPVPVAYLLTGPATERLGLHTTLAWAAGLVTTAALFPLVLPQVRRLTHTPARRATEA
ncbi:MFS transporter [Streptomyces sp. Je 1-369]|uniref:MFS transporter n=1 Tax=Streptomyces sp. Je 1-369 TaxID=2966192 RepID=UPI002286B38C|nr:MFS transporter [Streptomyces sp. Je 1-369]WAL94313.1 MFS transporter [Streptomyces sp. Je 1-369]